MKILLILKYKRDNLKKRKENGCTALTKKKEGKLSSKNMERQPSMRWETLKYGSILGVDNISRKHEFLLN